MEYTQYREMDSSGVSWLQKKPRHWRIKRLKFSTDLINSKVIAEESLLSYLGLEHIESWTGRKIDGEISNSEGLASSFIAGDVLFGKLRPYLAKVHLTQQAGLISSEALVIRSKDELHAEFLKYYMLSRDFINIVDSSTYGSKMPRASWDFIGNLPVLLPEVEEQKTIARFLDFKTAQIDALIAKQKTLLEKLAEKRTTLISHAVTKGLDPSVPMKESGVAWLGEIPAHWQVKRLKFLGKTRYGLGEPPQKLDGGLPFIRATDIYRGEIDGAKVQTVDPDCVPWSRNPALKAKDILVVRSGAYTGDSAIVPAQWEGSIAGYDMVYTAEGAFPEYVAFNLLSKYVLNGQIYLAKNRAAQPHLNAEELGGIVIALPPPEEQIEIVAYIEKCTKHVAVQFELVNGVIYLLHEYRSSLITNAVTGKIDVRGVDISNDKQTKEPAHA